MKHIIITRNIYEDICSNYAEYDNKAIIVVEIKTGLMNYVYYIYIYIYIIG